MMMQYREQDLEARSDASPREAAFATAKEKNIAVAAMWNEHVGLATEQAQLVAKAQKVSDVTEVAETVGGLSKPVKTYKGIESWLTTLEKLWKKEQGNRGLCVNDTGSGSTAGVHMGNELYSICDSVFSVLEHKAPPRRNLLSLGGQVQSAASTKSGKSSKKRTLGKKKEETKKKKQKKKHSNKKKSRDASKGLDVVRKRRALAEAAEPAVFKEMVTEYQYQNRDSSHAAREPSISDLQKAAHKKVCAWGAGRHPVVDCPFTNEICTLLCINLPTEANVEQDLVFGEEGEQYVVWASSHAGPWLDAEESDEDGGGSGDWEDLDDEEQGFGTEGEDFDDENEEGGGDNDDDDDDDEDEDDDDDEDEDEESEEENEVFGDIGVSGKKESRRTRESEQQWGASTLRRMVYQSKRDGRTLQNVTTSIGTLAGALTSFLGGGNGVASGGAGGGGCGRGRGGGGGGHIGRGDAGGGGCGGRDTTDPLNARMGVLETAVGEIQGNMTHIQGTLNQIAGMMQQQHQHHHQQQQQQQQHPHGTRYSSSGGGNGNKGASNTKSGHN
jgi:hypothetical protein